MTISVDEAEKLITENISSLQKLLLPIEQLGEEVLAETLIADRNIPSFSRIAMDGVALSTQIWEKGRRSFAIEGFQAAGDPQQTLHNSNGCIEVMTGAILPDGCDCVVRYEDIEIHNNKASLSENLELKLMQNVHEEGADYKKGDQLVDAGSYLLSTHWAVAASIGKSEVWVRQRPNIAIVSTGNELVDVNVSPHPYQIRKSNPYALQAALRSNSFTEFSLFHLPDNKETMVKELSGIVDRFDVVILTGGISMGKRDFIPEALQQLNVKKLFHRVRQRPGKPLWFGITEQGQPIFALPGNPVSALVCFHRYVLPALYRLIGIVDNNQPCALLTEEVHFAPTLTHFLPVKVQYTNEGKILATPRPTNGSGDFTSLVNSGGFIELPEHQNTFSAGTAFPLRRWNRER